MKYEAAAALLDGLEQRRPKLGIDTTERLLAAYDDPHRQYPSVQIAGSNGKGSTARMLEGILRAGGLHVGLFTSPALVDAREQITVDGRAIPRQQVARLAEPLADAIEELRAIDDVPTNFEAMTALALAHFAAEEVDIAVLEVGIGGRYDATSVVDPCAAAVTSVSLEHTELLGETIEEIAADKAQVAPADAPLVTATTGRARKTLAAETPIVTVGFEDADVLVDRPTLRPGPTSATTIEIAGETISVKLPLVGAHQALNAGVATTLAGQIADVDASAVADGLARARWPGRFEVVDLDPMVVLDGSHNPGAIRVLADTLAELSYDRVIGVVGVMQDKDLEAMAAALGPLDVVVGTAAATPRAVTPATVTEAFAQTTREVATDSTVLAALERAERLAGADDLILVTGSLAVVAEARDRYRQVLAPVVTPHRPTEGQPAGVRRSTARWGLHGSIRQYQRPAVTEALSRHGWQVHEAGVAGLAAIEPVEIEGPAAELEAVVDALMQEPVTAMLARQLQRAVHGVRGAPRIGWIPSGRPAIMGILNVTPDSFYDGGAYTTVDAAVEQANRMLTAGADIIDVGGESTRPGAEPVPVDEEIDRVVPVIEALDALGAPVSVDTRKAAVADAALTAGAHVVNDVSGLRDPEMPAVTASHDADLIVMHSIATPVDPSRRTVYDDVVTDVLAELTEQVLLAERAGIARERIIVDPGCGFGKSPAESYRLIDRLGEFAGLGLPVLIGHSRKSMFAEVTADAGDRLAPTLAMSALAADRGAGVLRVHDVGANRAVVDAVAAMHAAGAAEVHF